MADAPSLVDDTHMLSDDYAATEGGDGADTDNMLVADDEDEEQAAAERLREELKAKRRVSIGICCGPLLLALVCLLVGILKLPCDRVAEFDMLTLTR